MGKDGAREAATGWERRQAGAEAAREGAPRTEASEVESANRAGESEAGAEAMDGRSRDEAKLRPRRKPTPGVKEIKRLRSDERFYIGGQQCATRNELIATFARKLFFPDGWTPDWYCFERCMLDLTWLQKPWPPRRICFLTLNDADYLLARASYEDTVAFFTVIEAAKRHALLPFKFDGLVRKAEAMDRLEAADEEALSRLHAAGERWLWNPDRSRA